MALGDLFFADDFSPEHLGIPWTPVLPRERLEAMGEEELRSYAALRKKVEQDAIANPTGQGWILPSWQKVFAAWKKYPIIIILGGQRSSKSTVASRLCVWAAGTIPQAEVRCYHVNEDRSIEDQQRFVYDALPASIQALPTKKGVSHSIQYSQKNGFTDNICILPPIPGYRRGGTIKFGNYNQYKQDAQVTEGFKSHLIWGDEEMPQKMLETLIYRTVDYHGRIILTFTTLQGWSPLIQDILGKTKILEKRAAPLLGGIELPVVRESLTRPGAVIFNFWTEDNAFIDTSDFRKKIIGRSKTEILARAYGEPTKSVSGAFPQFKRDVNVVEHDKLPFLKKNLKKDPDGNLIPYPVTWFHSIDPAGRKPWFMVWVAIDTSNTWWVVKEWPDFGEWALPGQTPEGKPGPAQEGLGWGIKDYVELIRSVEEELGANVFERYIDPRAGAAEKQSQEGATTIISDLDDNDITVIPAPGVEIEHGLQLIQNLLAFDENKPVDSVNTPHLFVSDRCENVIYALQEYTAKAGKDEMTKDPVDCIRQLACAGADYVDVKAQRPQDNKTFSY